MKRIFKPLIVLLLVSAIIGLLIAPALYSTKAETTTFPTERNFSLINSLPGKEKDKASEVLKKKPKPKKSGTPSKSSPAKPVESPKPTVTSQPIESPKPTVTPQPIESPKPTVTPQPTVTPKPGRTPDEYGYLVPIVTFTTKSCVIKGSTVLLTYNVSLSEGNHYSYQEPWRGGRIWTVRDGRSWSFEYVEALPSWLINEPRTILPDRSLKIIGSNKTDYIPLPNLEFSSCK